MAKSPPAKRDIDVDDDEKDDGQAPKKLKMDKVSKILYFVVIVWHAE